MQTTASVRTTVDSRLTNFGKSSSSPTPRIPISVGSTLSKDQGIGDVVSDGYAVLILRPGGKQNILACRAFFGQFVIKTQKEVAKTNSNSKNPINYRPTYWLDKRNSLEYAAIQSDGPALAKACANLLENYDYERANFIASHFGFGRLSAPLLMAWTKEAKAAFVFDLSNYKIQKDFDKIMGLWQGSIASDPSIWNRRGVIHNAPWYIPVREAFNEAGAAVETAVRFWFENEAKGQILENGKGGK